MIGLGRGWPGWARSAPATIAQLVVGVGAMWAVPFFVPAFRIEGSPVQRIGGAAIAVAVVAVVGLGPAVAVRWFLGAGVAWLASRADPDLDDEAELDAGPLGCLAGVADLVIVFATFPWLPYAFMMVAPIADSVGLAVHVDGYWAAALTILVAVAVLVVVNPLLPGGRWPPWGRLLGVADTMSVAAGLAAALAVLPGMRLQAAADWRPAATVVLLSALWYLRPVLRGSGFGGCVSVVLAVVSDTLGLWALSWVSRWMEVTLFVAGFWTFVWAALIINIIYAPVWFTRTLLAERAQRAALRAAYESEELAEPEFW